jgi:syntaxin 16
MEERSWLLNDTIETEFEILEREREIEQIYSDMNDINDIFKTLNTLTQAQGYLIDNIENNIDNTVINVETAAVQLHQGSKKLESRNKICLIVLIILLVILIIFIIIIAVKNK